MKKVILVLICVIITNYIFSQNRENDTVLARIFFDKATEQMQLSNLDSALYYISECQTIYNQQKRGNKDFFEIYSLYGKIFFYKYDFEKSLSFFQKANSLLSGFCVDTSIFYADNYMYLGIVYRCMGDYEKSFDFLKKAITIYKRRINVESRQLAMCYNNIANLLCDLNYFSLAKDYYNNAYELISKEYVVEENVYIEKVEQQKENKFQKKDAKAFSGIENQRFEYKSINDFFVSKISLRIDVFDQKEIDLFTIYSNLATLNLEIANYEQSADLYLRAINFKSGNNIYSLSNIYLLLHSGLANIKSSNYFAYYFFTLSMNYGNLMQETDNKFSAVGFYSNAIFYNSEDFFENSYINAMFYNALASSLTFLSSYNEALKYFKKSYEIISNSYQSSPILLSSYYSNFANYNQRISNVSEALNFYNKSLDIQMSYLPDNHTSIAKTLNNTGNIYYLLNDFENAELCFVKSINMLKNLVGENNLFLVNCYNSLANIFCNSSQFTKAIDYYNHSLSIVRQFFENENNYSAMLYNNLANTYSQIDDIQNAEQYYSLAFNAYGIIYGNNNTTETSDLFINIGNMFAQKNNYKKAKEYYNKSLKIEKKILDKNSLNTALVYENFANVFYLENKNSKALTYYQKSLKIYKSKLNKNNLLFCKLYNNIGDVYQKNKKYQLAQYYYQKSLCSNLLGVCDTSNYELVPTIDNYLSWNELIRTLYNKAKIFEITQKNYSVSLNIYLTADKIINSLKNRILNQSDKLYLKNQAFNVYKSAADLCFKISKTCSSDSVEFFLNLSLYFSEKNKSSLLVDAINDVRAKHFAGIPDSLLLQENKLLLNIAFYQNFVSTNPDSVGFQLKLLEENQKLENFVKSVENKFPKYYELKYQNHNLNIKDVQNQLDSSTVIISYSICYEKILIFLISQKNCIVQSVEITDSLNQMIFQLVNSISNLNSLQDDFKNNSNSNVAVYQGVSRALYRLLFPVFLVEYLEKHKTTDIIIIPDGQLSRIPFETLLTDDYNAKWAGWSSSTYFSEMPFLIKKYNISYSYSLNLWVQTNKIKKTENEYDWIGFAPVFDENSISGTTEYSRQIIEKNSSNTARSILNGYYITPLPGSKEEVVSIYDLFNKFNKKAIYRSNNNANESSIKSEELQKFSIVHLATHGKVDEKEPRFSFILLAQDTSIKNKTFELTIQVADNQNEGFLYQSEIFQLKLNADLVVLSACETGLGQISQGEGLIGISRAFLYAGAKNIIVSLWQVDDQRTRDLMIDFYKNFLLMNNSNYSDELRYAKIKMIEEGRFAHPYFWSSFILIGH